jgi:isocitrate dehydrogenase (NAD+)
MRPSYRVTELLGDGIGPELSRAIHRLAETLPVQLEFVEIDLGLENRRARGNAVYDEAVASINVTKVALKHPTTTTAESPNAILRRRLDLSVIHRPISTIPGVPTNFRRGLDLDIVRIATGGTYDDPGRMIGEDGAVS